MNNGIAGLNDLSMPQKGYGLNQCLPVSKSGAEKNVNVLKDLEGFDLKHIWEIMCFLKCPVVGTCLTIREQRRILKKARCSTKALRPYQIHTAIMERLDSKNRVSVKLDNYLKFKYRKDIPILRELDEDGFMRSWRRFFLTERMEAHLFVSAVRKDISTESIQEIFGEIHMLGHANLHEAAKYGQDLICQVEINQKLAKRFNQAKTHARKLQKEMSSLRASLRESQSLLQKFKGDQKRVGNEKGRTAVLESENQALRIKFQELKAHSENQSEQLHLLERRKRRFEIKAFDLNATNEHLSNELSEFIEKVTPVVECTKCHETDCPKAQLADMRILIVGGITKMKNFYQRLVEKRGGIFEYHDGYMQNGQEGLEHRVKRCDLILCPVDCNSHGACSKVKKLGQKHGKPYKMLRRSSLSAISNALMDEKQKGILLQ